MVRSVRARELEAVNDVKANYIAKRSDRGSPKLLKLGPGNWKKTPHIISERVTSWMASSGKIRQLQKCKPSVHGQAGDCKQLESWLVRAAEI